MGPLYDSLRPSWMEAGLRDRVIAVLHPLTVTPASEGGQARPAG